MAISKRLRYEILRRDNHTCRYCGQSAPDVKLTVDHVTPAALGGTDEPSNLVAACVDCNAGKTSSNPDAPLVADVAADAIRWAKAQEQALEWIVWRTQERNALNDQLNDLWLQHCANVMGRESWRPEDWRDTLDTFRKHGLPQSEIIDAFWIMRDKGHLTPDRRWKYFCGICWRKITNIQEVTKQILNAEEDL